jgi:hypothetical protein
MFSQTSENREVVAAQLVHLFGRNAPEW